MASIQVVDVTRRFEPSAPMSSRSRFRQEQVVGYSERDNGSDVEPPSGKVLALDRASLHVKDGESMVILGSSGCGKSTLLRCIAGLESYEGDIFYGDQDMRDVPPKDRGIGIVFQNYALYPQFESKGNLSFFFKVNKREQEVDESVKLTSQIMGFGFDELLERKPKTLSGGQKQRVAIARAICRDPKLLLFDEPLSNLDAQLRSTTRLEIRRLINRFAITTLYVTHDQTEATIMGDRLAIMDQGRVLQVGTYHEVYDHPINTFVAGFLGLPPMNLFPGEVAGQTVVVNGAHWPVPARVQPYVVNGQHLIAGIRPEALRVQADGALPPDSAGVMTVTFEHVERLPSDRIQLLYAEAGDKRLVVRAPLDLPVPLREPVQLAAPADSLHLFNAGTGVRI
jgi:ABC-type sugar transport system ATPase subunit